MWARIKQQYVSCTDFFISLIAMICMLWLYSYLIFPIFKHLLFNNLVTSFLYGMLYLIRKIYRYFETSFMLLFKLFIVSICVSFYILILYYIVTTEPNNPTIMCGQ